jgi:hypothetical protein
MRTLFVEVASGGATTGLGTSGGHCARRRRRAAGQKNFGLEADWQSERRECVKQQRQDAGTAIRCGNRSLACMPPIAPGLLRRDSHRPPLCERGLSISRRTEFRLRNVEAGVSKCPLRNAGTSRSIFRGQDTKTSGWREAPAVSGGLSGCRLRLNARGQTRRREGEDG